MLLLLLEQDITDTLCEASSKYLFLQFPRIRVFGLSEVDNEQFFHFPDPNSPVSAAVEFF